jgi:hypothetical protein
VGFQNAGRAAPDSPGNGPQLSSSAADFQANSQIERPAQAEILRNPCAVREARLELLREAVHEACGFIRLHAEACQPLVEAGDDAGLLHSLGRLVIYTKHAARIGNELRDLRKELPP